jgi:hypothetical protein
MGGMTATPPIVPAAPPTTPGPVLRVRRIVWPRVIAVLAWIVAIPSTLLAAAAMGYPEFSGEISRRLGDTGHDDLAGTLLRYRVVDLGVEAMTIALAVTLCLLARRLWRDGPPAGRALMHWCLLKIALVVINLGLLFAQSVAYFGDRPYADADDARIGTLIMLGWSAALSLAFPVLTLLWLWVPGVRRAWAVSRCAGGRSDTRTAHAHARPR